MKLHSFTSVCSLSLRTRFKFVLHCPTVSDPELTLWPWWHSFIHQSCVRALSVLLAAVWRAGFVLHLSETAFWWGRGGWGATPQTSSPYGGLPQCEGEMLLHSQVVQQYVPLYLVGWCYLLVSFGLCGGASLSPHRWWLMSTNHVLQSCVVMMLSDLVSKRLLSYASSHLMLFMNSLFWHWGCFDMKKGVPCTVFTCSWLKRCCVSGWLSADQHPAGFWRRHSSVLLQPQLDPGGNQTRLQGCWNHPCHSAGRKHAGLRHHNALPARHV